MQRLSKTEVTHYLTETRALRNVSLQRHINAGGLFFRVPLADPESMQALIWHYYRESQVLTPGTFLGGKQYTVGQVADYMLQNDISFQDLIGGKIEGAYNPKWFVPCLDIAENFDFEKFDDLVVTLPTNSEQRDCPLGTFRVIDGIHRSLALSYLLATEAVSYQPLHCILVLKEKKMPWIIK